MPLSSLQVLPIEPCHCSTEVFVEVMEQIKLSNNTVYQHQTDFTPPVLKELEEEIAALVLGTSNTSQPTSVTRGQKNGKYNASFQKQFQKRCRELQADKSDMHEKNKHYQQTIRSLLTANTYYHQTQIVEKILTSDWIKFLLSFRIKILGF